MSNATTNTTELTLHPRQAEFISAPERVVGYMSGRGGGKTFVGVRWAWLMMLQYPRALGLITANSYKQLNEATLKALIAWLRDSGTKFIFNKRPPWYESRFEDHKGVLSLANGAQAVCRSLENYDDIRGAEYGWWWSDETRDTKKEAYDVALACMRDRNGPRLVRFTSTPNGYDWVYTLLEEEPMSNPELRFRRKLITGSTYDNLANLGVDFVSQLEESYDADFARQEIHGEFIHIGTGQVYSTFQRGEHVVPAADARWDKNKPVVLTCDFNVTPMCWCVAQYGDGGADIIIDEIHRDRPRMGMSPTESAAIDFCNRYRAQQAPILVFGDVSGSAQNTKASRTDYEIIRNVIADKIPGIRVVMKVPTEQPKVIDRVNAMNARFRSVRGKIGLRVSSKCQYTIRDLEQVVWKESGVRREIDKSDMSLTHHSDAVGYWIHAVYRGSRSMFGGGNAPAATGEVAEMF